jgi:quinol-cytochrome oxidoreductase complex cytochrome b subunit
MLGTGSIRELGATVSGELHKLRRFNWVNWTIEATDSAVRGVMAGLSAKELRAILRGDAPTEKPNPRYKAQVKSFMLHLRPKYYQRASTWFTHTWRLGWFSVFFFVVETITGIILMVFYAPTPERAYGDMLYILSRVPFGLFMRDLHRLGAEGMVLVVVLHMVRVFFTGSYKGPRKFTWLTGVVLLLVTLFLSFSGYLLPWDQLAYWAVTIGTSMAAAAPVVGKEANLLLRGGLDIWAGGLLRFYLLHVLLLPLVAIIAISIHYYKVAREHSISLPASVEEGELPADEKRHAEERIDLIPNLLIHEVMLLSVSTLLMVLAVATFFHAPLEAHADQGVTPLHTTAPWYFLWLQGMLKLGDPTLMGVILPTIIFGLLFAVPWIDRNPNRLARRRPWAIGMGLAVTIMILVLTYMGLPQYGIETPQAQDILSHLVPATHPGPLKETPWDEIGTGPDGEEKVYFVSYPEEWENNPAYQDKDRYEFVKGLHPEAGEPDDEFHKILHEFKAEVENATKLLPPYSATVGQFPAQYPLATVTVSNRQPGLKWLDLRITWDELVLDPKTKKPTHIINYMIPDIDLKTGKPRVGADGKPILDPKTKKPTMVQSGAVVYDPGTGQPFLRTKAGKTIPFVDGTAQWTNEVGEVLSLKLADAVPNIKKNNFQRSAIAAHKDSHYEH